MHVSVMPVTCCVFFFLFRKSLLLLLFHVLLFSVGIRFVKGFIVMRYRSDTVDVMCYVYDLSNATWKSGTEDFKVNCHILSLFLAHLSRRLI